MKLKKIIWWFNLSALGAILLLIGYLFNEEKFFKEYWLQKKVERLTSHSKKIASTGDEQISYEFFFDNIIDLTIALDNNGNFTITRHLPGNDSSLDKTLYYYTDTTAFQLLSRDFSYIWRSSSSKDTDYKLGGTYYTLTYRNQGIQDKEIIIGYYNYLPDDDFITFKNKILTLTSKLIAKSR